MATRIKEDTNSNTKPQSSSDNMPECENCGAHVSEAYLRVREPEYRDKVRACPNCPDLMRDGAEVREKKYVSR